MKFRQQGMDESGRQLKQLKYWFPSFTSQADDSYRRTMAGTPLSTSTARLESNANY